MDGECGHRSRCLTHALPFEPWKVSARLVVNWDVFKEWGRLRTNSPWIYWSDCLLQKPLSIYTTWQKIPFAKQCFCHVATLLPCCDIFCSGLEKKKNGMPHMLGTHRWNMHHHHLVPPYFLPGLFHGIARDDLSTVPERVARRTSQRDAASHASQHAAFSRTQHPQPSRLSTTGCIALKYKSTNKKKMDCIFFSYIIS